MKPATRRALTRAGLLTLATLVALGLALLYPALARGDELLSASWRHPYALLLLLLVPVVFWRATLGEDQRSPRMKLGTTAPFLRGPVGARVWLRDIPGVLRAVGLGLAILALARPINTLRPQTADERGIDIVLVLDLSGSMQAVIDNLPKDLGKYVTRRDTRIRPTRTIGNHGPPRRYGRRGAS